MLMHQSLVLIVVFLVVALGGDTSTHLEPTEHRAVAISQKSPLANFQEPPANSESVIVSSESLQVTALPTPPRVNNEVSFFTRPAPTPTPIPVQTPTPVNNTPAPPAPVTAADCGYGEILTAYRSYSDWYRTLLDLRYMVPSNYYPADLVPASNAGVRIGAFGTPYVRSLVIGDLTALTNAVRDAGFGQLKVNTGFRDYHTQAGWWNSYRNNGGALTYPSTLPPGHSEHQLGTTLDIDVYAAAGLNNWMSNNAWKYGFVKSYPPGRNVEHCIASEDWHYRYLGRDLAAQVTNSGLTVRHYLMRLQP